MKGQKYQDDRSFSDTSMTAGVESGISSFEALKRGATSPMETTAGDGAGSTSRQSAQEIATGSKAGKNFKIKY